LGCAVRNHDDLSIAAVSDAHRRDAFGVPERHVHGAAILRVHGLESDGPARLPRAGRGPLRDPSQVGRPLIGIALPVEHHALGVVARDLDRGLVREQLERVDAPPLATGESLRRRTADLEDHEVGVLARLRHLEGTDLHALDQSLHELADLPERAAHCANRGTRIGLDGFRGPTFALERTSFAATVAIPVALPTVASAAAPIAIARSAPPVAPVPTAAPRRPNVV